MDDPTTTAATEGFGLMFYNARWYEVQLGRFAQADTIIPLQTQGVQAWDRYAGMNNNPVKYTDPSGHVANACLDNGWCGKTGNGLDLNFTGYTGWERRALEKLYLA
ncbi:MAG: RHS repeat-associated core domain-containing protein [Anaerolineales bacterium]|nr:RHS repeat-associated core domain-containing protein [Anaerolineales bacterium]